jgi:hypothetical protein
MNLKLYNLSLYISVGKLQAQVACSAPGAYLTQRLGQGTTHRNPVGTTDSALYTDPRHRAKNELVTDLNPEGKLPTTAD